MQNGVPNDLNLPFYIDKTFELDQPDLQEVCSVMRERLGADFHDFHVDVVQCPDLKVFPYFLVASGLCGHAEVIEFGNHKHLYDPSKNKAISWELPFLIDRYTQGPSFVIGGSMFHGISNKEVIMNLTYSREEGTRHESQYTFVNEEGQIVSGCIFNSMDPPPCDLYGSLYVCDGKQNDILEVYARGSRYPDAQILNMMQNALDSTYFNANVGLSGLLFISSGTVEANVMPRTYSQILLEETDEIYNWNHKYNLSAPLVVHNTMFNFDRINVTFGDERWQYDEQMSCTVNNSCSHILRAEFTGGRFLKSITPLTMQFKGYFNVVSKLHRVGAELINLN